MAKVSWPMTRATYSEYLRIFNDLVTSAKAADTLKHEFAREELQSLPGYPQGIHPDLDRVVPVIEDATSRIVTFGSTIQ